MRTNLHFPDCPRFRSAAFLCDCDAIRVTRNKARLERLGFVPQVTEQPVVDGPRILYQTDHQSDPSPVDLERIDIAARLDRLVDRIAQLDARITSVLQLVERELSTASVDGPPIRPEVKG